MTDNQEKLTFEQALEKLEDIVAAVEQGKVSLEESIEKYEQGMKLINDCRKMLDQAEQRVQKINQPETQD